MKAKNVFFRSCRRCGGNEYLDLLDEPEWRCLQCARPIQAQLPVQLVPPAGTLLRLA